MLREEFDALWRAVRAGNPAAERRLINACFPRLVPILRHRFVVLPVECIEDAAYDALVHLIRDPDRYDPHKGSLLNYLIHIGNNKLIDAYRQLRRRRELPVGGSVELALIETNQYRGADYREPDFYDPGSLPPDVEAFLTELLPDPQDRAAFDLYLQEGRAAVAQYAAIWGLDHLPSEQQETLVKQNRDRIMKKVRRKKREFRELLYGEI
ncbi:MAG: hypothetical protein JWN14_1473 [Chthonomonadales bacterium]|nr:hypothetical protein [Chthonomonadales bacterium]